MVESESGTFARWNSISLTLCADLYLPLTKELLARLVVDNFAAPAFLSFLFLFASIHHLNCNSELLLDPVAPEKKNKKICPSQQVTPSLDLTHRCAAASP